MTTIVDYTEPFSQDSFQDYADKLVYQDCVIKSGIAPDIFRLNFQTAIGEDFYEGLFLDRDKTTNSNSSGGSSLEAARNRARCMGDAVYFLGSKIYLLSDLAGDTKAARFGYIKSEGIFRPAGMPAIGFRTPTGRYRQLAGAPIALDLNKSTGVYESRRYHQATGNPLEVFLPRVTVRVWKLVADKAGLPMPEFPVIGLNGEAIGFWKWVKDTNCPIVITEGEKKACCLISRGYAAIGLPGIRTGYRVTKYGEEVTKPDGTTYRKALAWELCEVLQFLDTPDREITILFDYREGDYSESEEFKAATATAKLFKNAIAKIAQLPGPDKGIDDFAIAGGDVDAVVADAKDYRKLAIKAQWRRCRNYIPDYIINTRHFHAPEPAADTITGIKSGLATGKTQWLIDIIASNPNGKIIVLGSRNGLLLETARKCGVGFYHLDAHNGYQMFKDPNARLLLCFDSLLKLPPEIFEGATIILDEAESVLRHLLMSPTLKHNREVIKARFTQACKDASRIILLDGHLTDYTVNLIAKLAGNKTVTKHLNEFKKNCPKVSVYKTEKATPTAAEKQDYINKILASECPVIPTDCSVAEAEALAKTLTEEKGPGLLMCSKTSDKPNELEFQTDPDAWIEKHNPNSIIYTPTLENGLDISEWKGCTDVFGLFCGNLGVNSQIQMLRRVRHPINQISVLCPQIGLSDNPDRRSYYGNQIKLQIEVNIDIENALLCPEDYREVINAHIDSQRKDPLFWACCDYEAQENLEKTNLREFLIEALIDDGYEVDEPTLGEDESGDHANKKIACKEQESQEIFNSPDISFEEAKKISRSNKARWPERCQADKAFLKAKLPAVETTKLWTWEFVHRIRGKDSSLLNHLENSWLFHNSEDAEYLQKSKWELGYFESFLPDHDTRWLKLRTLHELNIMQLLNPDSDGWTNESPEIKKLLKDGNRKDAKRILGEPGKDGIKYANKLLGLLGVKLVSRTGRGEDGKWQRTYHYQPEPTWKEAKAGPKRECSLPEDWDVLAELTAVRMNQKVEFKRASTQSTEPVTPTNLESVADPPDFININLGVSATETTPENTVAAGGAGAISQAAIEVEAELPPEVEAPGLPEPEAPIAPKAWAWFQRKLGEWIECRVLEFIEGRYILEAKSMIDSGMIQFRAYPEDLRWEAPNC